ncbi:MAG: DMT family protein [Candidatus Hydrogenedentes bacterium]|nr:DMT family protein [Candidatus Hydrogenedentota bacterium]
MRTVVLLTRSNIFMTIAWYGHLKYKGSPLWQAVLVSWGIAFLEYCLQVPANRLGHYQFSAAQLRTIQEVIRLAVFCIFSGLYLKEGLRWNYVVGFLMIVGAVVFIFKKW